MITFKQTLNDIKSDFDRRLLLENRQFGFLNKLHILFKQGSVCVILYRLSRYFFYSRLRFINRFLVILEHLYCKSEVSPMAKIGPGFVCDGVAIGISHNAIIGRNCTFLGRNTVSLGAIEGVNLKKDRIEIGDYCVMGNGARLLRPVRVADGVQILPNSVVISSELNQGSAIFGIPARRQHINPMAEIEKWNPLYGGYIGSER